MNVSILGGFTYGDTPFNGMSFIVTTRGNKQRAEGLCRDLAEMVWQGRDRLLPELTSLSSCIEMAVDLGMDTSKPPAVIADVADNPGGGGRGNTTWLLKGLFEAKAKGVILGVFFDAPLATEAHALRVGDKFDATFNRVETSQYSEPFTAEAEILNLSRD